MGRLSMVRRVLVKNSVETDAKPIMRRNYLARTFGNLFQALLLGENGTFRILPDTSEWVTMDYRRLGPPGSGSLGWNVPPWVEKNRGKVVEEMVDRPRYGKVLR